MARFGRPHRHLRECGSTNTVGRELAIAGAPDGTVVTADRQTAGRGRQGRSWATLPAGAALSYSAIHRGRISPLLSLAAAIAVCEAIESLTPLEPQIKWPNDVWIEQRKCAGILVEARPQDGWAVIGIGINLNVAAHDFPVEVRDNATSVGHGATPSGATAALNRALARWTEASDAAVTAEFRRRDALKGRPVRWSEGSGIADGIDEHGSLIVRGDEGSVHALPAGEVHLLR